MTVETLTRPEAETERDELIEEMERDHGTSDRDELRDLSLSGELTFEQIGRVDRLRTLDYLLGE